MDSFVMNGYLWRVKYVYPNSPMLVDRTGTLTVATTDPYLGCVFISNSLPRAFRTRVLIHELGHCALFSYGLLRDIHRIVRIEHWIEAEEWVCNFLADYGAMIFRTAYNILGEDAWMFIAYELERLIA